MMRDTNSTISNYFVLPMLLCLALVATTRAQDTFDFDETSLEPTDTLADPGNVARENETTEPTEAADATSTATSNNPAVREIVDANPTSPAELLRAVDLLVKLDELELANTYLKKLVESKLDRQSMARLQQEFGSGVFVQLAQTKALNPLARTFVADVFQAVSEYHRDPKRITSLVRQLQEETDARVRKKVIRQLIQSGPAAVPYMLRSVATDPDTDSARLLRTGIARIGTTAVGPLIAFLESSNESERVEAIRILGFMQSAKAVPFLTRHAFVERFADQERVVAKTALSHILGSTISRKEAISVTKKFADMRYRGEISVDVDADGLATAWVWNRQDGNPVLLRLPAKEIALLEAARHDITLAWLLPESTSILRRRIITQAGAAKILGGIDGKIDRDHEVVQLARDADQSFLSKTFAKAMRDRQVLSLVGLAEILSDVGQQELLHLHRGSLPPLTKGVIHANARVRFAAADAVSQIGLDVPFAGDSLLANTLGHFASSRGRRAVLIAHPRPDAAQTLAGLVRQMGFETETAVTAAEFLAKSDDTIDFEFYFISDAFDHPVTMEIVQQLRRNPFTAHTPVAVLARSRTHSDAEFIAELNPNVIVLTETKDRVSIGQTIQRLHDLQGKRYVPPARRTEMAKVALSRLLAIAQRPEVHTIDLSRFDRQVIRSSGSPELAEESIRLLSYIPTMAAQTRLLSLVGFGNISIEMRDTASNAFAKSVERHGLLLTRQIIESQYDVYNASETAEPATRSLLAKTLDVIEQRLAP